MDSWSPDQLRKMQHGGNAKLNMFLKQYGIEKNMDIKEKYNTRAAEVSQTGATPVLATSLHVSLNGSGIPGK